MDELVSVPVTHPVRFLKGTIKVPPVSPPVRKDPPVRQPAQKKTVKDPPIRRPTQSPTTSLQKKNLAQEWLDF